MWFEVKDLQAHKKAPYIFPVLKELEARLRMGIYEDRQIHTKASFRPIKLQESQSGPHTNQTPSNKQVYYTVPRYLHYFGQIIRMDVEE